MFYCISAVEIFNPTTSRIFEFAFSDNNPLDESRTPTVQSIFFLPTPANENKESMNYASNYLLAFLYSDKMN